MGEEGLGGGDVGSWFHDVKPWPCWHFRQMSQAWKEVRNAAQEEGFFWQMDTVVLKRDRSNFGEKEEDPSLNGLKKKQTKTCLWDIRTDKQYCEETQRRNMSPTLQVLSKKKKETLLICTQKVAPLALCWQPMRGPTAGNFLTSQRVFFFSRDFLNSVQVSPSAGLQICCAETQEKWFFLQMSLQPQSRPSLQDKICVFYLYFVFLLKLQIRDILSPDGSDPSDWCLLWCCCCCCSRLKIIQSHMAAANRWVIWP